MRMRNCCWPVALCLATGGCGGAPSPEAPSGVTDAVPTAPALDDPAGNRWEQVLEGLRKKNSDFQDAQANFQEEAQRIVAVGLDGAGASDISPLAGLPLQFLSLKGCPVSDLAPIRGMPLRELAVEETQVADLSPVSESPVETLWLNNAPVSDLSPLSGLPLKNLHLVATKVTDLAPLRGMPLEQLWLNETQVVDVSPLAECPLVSLTLHKTPVRDIAVVRSLPTLQRLHIGETEITDLRPLAGLRLTRLIFTPGRITEGLDVARRMDTLAELDVELRERPWSSDEFWRRYDAGELR
jgi:hypothetical protein